MSRNLQLRSACPLAAALDLVGDRWSLVILRDILAYGPRRFQDLMEAGERVATNMLTDRLRRLEEAGLITAEAYQHRPQRFQYAATQKGLDMFPAIAALAGWAQKHVPGVSQEQLKLPPRASGGTTRAGAVSSKRKRPPARTR